MKDDAETHYGEFYEPEPIEPIDSDVEIVRDLTRVDAYLIAPHGERVISVPASLLIILAQAVRNRGENATMDALIAFRDDAD